MVWIFDLKTKKGRKLALPGVGFANDPAVMGNALYISDNRNDKLVKVEPADFLNAKDPKVTEVFAGNGINPNGVYPARDGMLLIGGFLRPTSRRPLRARGGQIKQLSDPIGRLDGLYEMADGSLLFTDWNTGSLSHWSEKAGSSRSPTVQGPGRLHRQPGSAASEHRFLPAAGGASPVWP